MLGSRLVPDLEHGLCEGKLQDDVPFLIGDFDHRIQEAGLRTFGAQQFQDHGSRGIPCAVCVAQHFAFGVGDQFIADAGVEKISRHNLTSWVVKA